MELLDSVMIVLGMNSAEEGKSISEEQKQRLAQLLEERVPDGLACADEWNELLAYFAGLPPEPNGKAAKKKLIAYLRGE